MPLSFLLIAAGIFVGFLGLCTAGDLRFYGIALLILGMLGAAVTSTRRRERDRRADQADREQAARLARR